MFTKITDIGKEIMSGLSLFLLLSLIVGCATVKEDKKIAATVSDHPIYRTEVNRKASKEISKLEKEKEILYKNALNELIVERLLVLEASQKNMDVKTLLKKEVYSKISNPTKDNLYNFYHLHKERYPNGFKKSQTAIRRDLEQFLISQKSKEYLKYLLVKNRVKIESPISF